jgi:hypothetical protein
MRRPILRRAAAIALATVTLATGMPLPAGAQETEGDAK